MGKHIMMLVITSLFALVQGGCDDSSGAVSVETADNDTIAGSDMSAIRGDLVDGMGGEDLDAANPGGEPSTGANPVDSAPEVVPGGSDTVPGTSSVAGMTAEGEAAPGGAIEDVTGGSTVQEVDTAGTDNGAGETGGSVQAAEGAVFEATVSCTNDTDCPAGQACRNTLCENELQNEASDTVRLFRLQEVEVIEPAIPCDSLIEAVLIPILQRNTFNLLLEPGGYVDDDGGYLWYIGNGAHYTDNSYRYIDGYPVQNFVGTWRQRDGEAPYWLYEQMSPFLLNVPSGTRDIDNPAPGEPSFVRCYSQLNIPVTDLRITPNYPASDDRNISPTLNMVFRGFLDIDDAELVEFELNGITTPLTRILESCATVDRDGDGVGESYPFHFEGVIREVVPNANLELPLPDGSNRDPNAIWENPPVCD